MTNDTDHHSHEPETQHDGAAAMVALLLAAALIVFLGYQVIS